MPPDPRADAAAAAPASARTEAPLVAWGRVGRRMGVTAAVAVGIALAGWIVAGVVGDGPTLRSLGGWVGLAVAIMFVAEVVFVGGAAIRGMLRAGERGERLASGDVSLLPPQLTRRLRRR